MAAPAWCGTDLTWSSDSFLSPCNPQQTPEFNHAAPHPSVHPEEAVSLLVRSPPAGPDCRASRQQLLSRVAGRSPLAGAAYSVTNTDYSGTGSLGAEIAAAVAANDSAAVITFSGVAADSTIQLSSSDVNSAAAADGPTAFFIDGNSGTNITINGSWAAPGLVIDGGSAVRLFAVASGNALTLENLTLEHGNATGAAGAAGAVSGTGAGGGVYVSDGGTFTALDCTFTNNNAQGGTGADTTSGPPPVDSGGGDAGYGGATTSAFKNGGGGGDTSGASGGVSGTGGAGNGGGIFSNGGALTLDNDTFTANSAIGGTGPTDGQGLGGAIFADGGSLALLNDTISGNTAAQGGRGVYVGGVGATATINNTIIGQSDTGVSDFVANGRVHQRRRQLDSHPDRFQRRHCQHREPAAGRPGQERRAD